LPKNDSGQIDGQAAAKADEYPTELYVTLEQYVVLVAELYAPEISVVLIVDVLQLVQELVSNVSASGRNI
jgi:hypothetical protein